MLFDTDIFIWVQRGNIKAANLIDRQSARISQQHHYINDFLSTFGFVVLPLSEKIGHRALIYIEEYALSHGLRAGDAIIAATAVENSLSLVSSNIRHFKPIRELKLNPFLPH